MDHFDIIVIGGGPAGCYAALTAATMGRRVALLEEHWAIGWPRHDPGWLMESEFTASLLGGLGRAVPWTKVREYRVCNPVSGELIEKSSRGGYTLRRDLLEKELAILAVQAGTSLYLKCKVSGLIKTAGRVEGVETESSILPKARAEVIICADGIRSAGHGFAVREGLCESAKVRPGLSFLLANAEVSAGVIEHFVSSDPLLNYKTFFTQGDGLSFLGFSSLAAFYELKDRTDNLVSRKIKRAHPVEVTGVARASSGKYAQYFKKIVKDNVLFIGDASGGAGNIHGMIQGQLAATVASAAIKDNDVNEKRLLEYQDRVFHTLGKAPFSYFSAREDFGSFDNWFRAVEQTTRGMKAKEISGLG